MLVIRSKEINAQLESAMMKYEQGARQVLADGQYANPYHVEPIALTPKRAVEYLLYGICLDGCGFCFRDFYSVGGNGL